MASTVKLSAKIVAVARTEAALMRRSIAGQVEYWAELGRSVEASGLLDYDRVRRVLSGDGSVHALRPADTSVYLRALGDEIERLDGADTDRIRKLERAGHPIAGEDESGKLRVRGGRTPA